MLQSYMALLLTVVSLFSVQATQEQYKYTVRGRVVNDRGQPIARAIVTVHPPRASTSNSNAASDELIEYVQTDSEGRFLFRSTSSLSTSARVIYVTAPPVLSAYAPINAPFGQLSDISPSFAGQPIRILKNSEVDLGDVPLQVAYGIVVLHLRDSVGKPLFTNTSQWYSSWLRLRDERGRVVSEFGLSRSVVEMYVRLSESALALALPVGTWNLEVSPSGENGEWYALDNVVVIQASCKPQQVILSVPHSK